MQATKPWAEITTGAVRRRNSTTAGSPSWCRCTTDGSHDSASPIRSATGASRLNSRGLSKIVTPGGTSSDSTLAARIATRVPRAAKACALAAVEVATPPSLTQRGTTIRTESGCDMGGL